jgi:hypothetical protein
MKPEIAPMDPARTKIIACATVIEKVLPLPPPQVQTQTLDFGLHLGQTNCALFSNMVLMLRAALLTSPKDGSKQATALLWNTKDQPCEGARIESSPGDKRSHTFAKPPCSYDK